MTDATRGFLRDNLVLVAAFALPAVVAGLFVLATAIPKWTVDPPQHDLVLKVDHYRQPAVIVDFVARDGRLEADVRAVPRPQDPNVGVPYSQRWSLLLFDHETMQVREVPVDLPTSLADGESRTVVVEALAGRYVTSDTEAPDGYRVTSLSTGGGGGIVGELFGMSRRYRRGIAIGKSGRTIELDLPAPHGESYGTVVTIGWVR